MRKKTFLLLCALAESLSVFSITITFCNGNEIIQRDVTSGGTLLFPTTSDLTCPNSAFPILAGWTTDNITSVSTIQPSLSTSASNITTDAVYYAIWKDNPQYTWEQIDDPNDAKNAYVTFADLTTYHVQIGANLKTITNMGSTPNNDALAFRCEAVSGVSSGYYFRPITDESLYLVAHTGTPIRYDVDNLHSAYYNNLVISSYKEYWRWSSTTHSLTFHVTPNSQDERNVACQYQLTYNTYNNRNRIEAMGYLYYNLAYAYSWVGESNLKIWKRGNIADKQYIGYDAPLTTLDPNGGKLNGSSASKLLTSEMAKNLPQCTPATGKVFLGWSTNPSATMPEYGWGASYQLGSPCTLYAIYGNRNTTYWEKIESLPGETCNSMILVVSDSYGDAVAVTKDISSTSLLTTPVTIQNNKLVNPSSNMQWTWNGKASTPIQNGSQYLYHNSGVASFVYSGNSMNWKIVKSEESNGFWIYQGSKPYYDFGFYADKVSLKSENATQYYKVSYMHDQYTELKKGATTLPHLTEATSQWIFAIFTIFVPKSGSLNYVFIKRGAGAWTDSDTNTDKIISLMTGESITLPSVTPPEDYRFDGWTDGNNTYVAGQTISPQADLVLKPIYTSIISEITLSETADNSSLLTENAKVHVNTIRSLSASSLNTFCVPFSVSADEFESFFGANCQLYIPASSSLSDNALTIYCDAVNPKEIEAGIPYLIQPQSPITNKTFDKRTITAVEPSTIHLDDINYIGVYNPTLLNTDENVLFLGQNNYLYRPASDGYMNGLRAYFRLTNKDVQNVPCRVSMERLMATDLQPLNVHQVQPAKFIWEGKFFIQFNHVIYDAQGRRVQ